MTHPLADKIESIAPQLRKYAAHRSGSHYADDLAAMTQAAQDLYQLAVTEILATCSPDDNKTYMLRLANWRMQNAVNGSKIYSQYVTTESDLEDAETVEFDFPDQSTTSPENIIILLEAAHTAVDILEALPSTPRDIGRRMRKGETIMDIARELGLTHQAVRYHVARIRAAFMAADLVPATFSL